MRRTGGGTREFAPASRRRRATARAAGRACRSREDVGVVAMIAILLAGLLMIAWQHSQWTDLGYTREAAARARRGEAEKPPPRLELETLRGAGSHLAAGDQGPAPVAPKPTERSC